MECGTHFFRMASMMTRFFISVTISEYFVWNLFFPQSQGINYNLAIPITLYEERWVETAHQTIYHVMGCSTLALGNENIKIYILQNSQPQKNICEISMKHISET